MVSFRVDLFTIYKTETININSYIQDLPRNDKNNKICLTIMENDL
jgi:hypothetical protein